MATVFISYNRESEATTKALADDIESLGHTVWFDKAVSGGQAWWDQILSKIRDSDIFVFVLDTEALNSHACKREYGYAAELGKPILPILAASDVSTNLLPPALSKIQFVDYRKTDREAAFRLARALITIPSPTTLPDPLPSPPEAPISYLGDLAEQVNTTSTLSYEKQTAILFDLKREIRNKATTDVVVELIKKFRNRRDLFASVAEEIDDLIIDKEDVAPPVSQPEETQPYRPMPKASTSEAEIKSESHKPSGAPRQSAVVSDNAPALKERIVSGCIFGTVVAVLNVILGTLTSYQGWYLSNFWNRPTFYIVIIGGFIVGLISGKDRRAIIGGVVGFSPMIISPGQTEWGLSAAVLALIGSIIGTQISKRKDQTQSRKVGESTS